MKKPIVSVIVPAYNEENFISSCLKALVNQKTSVSYEVIVVDNASTDKTASVARAFNVRVISEPGKGRGSARQTGCMTARGEILLFTEADTQVPLDWIERMYGYIHTDPEVSITGPMRIDELSLLQRVMINILQPMMVRSYRLLYGYFFLAGFNMSVSRAIWKKAGGFRRGLNTYDDIAFSEAVVDKGFRIRFVPDLVVVASARRFKGRFWRGMYDYIEALWVYKRTGNPVFTDPRHT